MLSVRCTKVKAATVGATPSLQSLGGSSTGDTSSQVTPQSSDLNILPTSHFHRIARLGSELFCLAGVNHHGSQPPCWSAISAPVKAALRSSQSGTPGSSTQQPLVLSKAIRLPDSASSGIAG